MLGKKKSSPRVAFLSKRHTDRESGTQLGPPALSNGRQTKTNSRTFMRYNENRKRRHAAKQGPKKASRNGRRSHGFQYLILRAGNGHHGLVRRSRKKEEEKNLRIETTQRRGDENLYYTWFFLFPPFFDFIIFPCSIWDVWGSRGFFVFHFLIAVAAL